MDDVDCLSNGTANVTEPAVVNNIQEKLLRMESDYAKRLKIQEICYKKKLSDLQRNNMDLNRQMQVSIVDFHSFIVEENVSICP